MDLVSGAIVGGVANELLVALREAIQKCIGFRSLCRRLARTLEEILPLMTDVLESGSELPQVRHRQLREFHRRLKMGVRLVEECSRVGRFNVFQRYRYSRKIASLDKYITNFSIKQGWAHTLCDMQHLRVDTQRQWEDISRKIDKSNVLNVLNQFNGMHIGNGMHIDKGHHLQSIVPTLEEFCVGLDASVEELKRIFLGKNVSLLGVNGMGGSGKTTLVTAFCNDPTVRGIFQERILFETVSQSPNLLGIIERMWVKFLGGRVPTFLNIEDARRQFQHAIQQSPFNPKLVVLDDIWRKDHLEKLLFKANGITTLITTRDGRILDSNSMFELRLLTEADAMKLFCHWAFQCDAIPPGVDCELVKQIVAECKGLPLAIKVIARSLQNEPYLRWKSAREKLAQGKFISEDHKECVVECMVTSLDVLEKDVKECFLDLGIFPEDQKNAVDVLLDIWCYGHHLDWEDAYTVLVNLARRNLLTLVNTKENSMKKSYCRSFGVSFTQHDVLRDLALYMAKRDPIPVCERLTMSDLADTHWRQWKYDGQDTFQAKFVSFCTGPMAKEDWSLMYFPNAKILLLNFTAEHFFLPPFIQTMHKLEHLEKLSLILCHSLGNLNGLQSNYITFPRLLGLTIDHCSTLEELPLGICNMTSLKNLCITNCHDLIKLPDELGNLSALQVLKLYACPSIENLPVSISKLTQLESLDISLCESLRQLPDELGLLTNLKELDMRECSCLTNLPRSFHGLKSLLHVMCDENVEPSWHAIQANLPYLKVEVVEKCFHLDWLDD
eukprot:TRINITY_DN3947_c0_g1_i2.p1 TRINITY_DN3947_c0_g1~~TRINITY_DN3947_c0_g1_i2.p1  ORF type:complete len:782 (-),score=106.67 TRINITY_DN3947_c0_g1_i2:88-2433(-)